MKPESNWYENANPITPDQIKDLGPVLVVAPHQDDESLGCGGTIALLKNAGLTLNVLFTSDGSMSHPNSKTHSAEKLVSLREQEAIDALRILGVDEEAITFMRLKDSRVPEADSAGFDEAVHGVVALLKKLNPSTIILPWRRDPHQDHRATWQIVNGAIKRGASNARVLEYFVWLWERAVPGELPESGEGVLWKINIEKVLNKKIAAIAAHISQTTHLINDDPKGFTLSEHMLQHFENPNEFFFELK